MQVVHVLMSEVESRAVRCVDHLALSADRTLLFSDFAQAVPGCDFCVIVSHK